jgi:polyisoprenoid-binding protein YceI
MSKNLWVIDPVHSEITFKVRHMMITNVSGTFDRMEAKMHSGEKDFSDAEISFEADIDSINTRNEQRDAHLKSNDFFDAASHPKLTFKSTQLKHISGNEYQLMGNFCMRGVEKEISLKTEFTGTVIDPWGQVKAGFEINGVLMRSDYGLVWNAANEEGEVVLSEEVKLQLNIQMIKQI